MFRSTERTRYALRCTTIAAACVLLSLTATACANEAAVTGPSTPSGIGILGGSAQVAAVGAALPTPLVVHVTDQYGVADPGVVVTFAASGGATLGASSATTDASGNATTTVTVGAVVGVDTVTATIAGGSVPARFIENAVAGPATTIAIVGGNAQTGTSGTPLALPLSVQLKDRAGNAVINTPVTFVSGANTFVQPTDSTGTANLTYTPTLGANTINVSVAGTALTATFVETGN